MFLRIEVQVINAMNEGLTKYLARNNGLNERGITKAAAIIEWAIEVCIGSVLLIIKIHDFWQKWHDWLMQCNWRSWSCQ